MKTKARHHEVQGRVTKTFYSTPGFSAGVIRKESGQEIRFAGKILATEGDHLVLEGYFKKTKYGLQLQVESFRHHLPTDRTGLANYLATHPNIKGIGPAKAAVIAGQFGDDFDDALVNKTVEMANAAKVSISVIENLRDEWTRTRAFNAANTWLAAFELTHRQITTLIKKYGNSVVGVFKENPYRLIQDIKGYGFKKVDKIARRMGVAKENPDRIRAGILQCVNEELDSGHTWTEYRELLDKADALLLLDGMDGRDLVEAELDGLITDKQLACDSFNGWPVVARFDMRRMEHDLAGIFRKASNLNFRFGGLIDLENLIDTTSTTLNSGQRKAVLTSLSHKLSVITGGAGVGKAQPLDANILSPDGWVQMGDLKLGDHIIGSNGLPCKVMGIFPQGIRDVFKVTMTDGSSTECCDEHLWQTQSQKDRDLKRPGSVKSLKAIRGSLTTSYSKRNHWIPIVQPVEFKHKELPLDPYLMGLLLGDGCFRIRGGCGICNPDQDIIDAVRLLLPNGCSLTQSKNRPIDYRIRGNKKVNGNTVFQILGNLELSGRLSSEKFIPDLYKYAASAHRLALLQGLLDTDGYASQHVLEYSTSSKRLARDVRFLVQSLGGTCSVAKRNSPVFYYRGEKRTGKPNYRLILCMPGYIQPFRLPRKAAKYRPRTKYLPRRAIEKIEHVGRKEVQCISVNASDQLYVTDDFIVTHNTYIVNSLCDIFQNEKYHVTLCAPTGKAAKRLEESTGRSAQTIHRLLGYNGREFQNKGPIETDLLAVDEVSMCDVPLLWHLLRIVDFSRTTVVLVGDHNQLPPIGPGNVLRDLIKTEMVPVSRLTEVVRQAGELKRNCSAILKGQIAKSTSEEKNGLKSWYPVLGHLTADDAKKKILHLYADIFPNMTNLDILRDVQLLTPLRARGPLSVNALNVALQKLLQKTLHKVDVIPPQPNRRPDFLLHDKVIQRRNNYDLGVMNGTVGYVTDVKDNGDLHINFDGDWVLLKKSEGHLGDIDLAYALTFHQAQGSEFPVAIVVCHKSHSFMHHRNLLYTGVTRAKQSVVLVGDHWGVRHCAEKEEASQRRTFLSQIPYLETPPVRHRALADADVTVKGLYP